MGRGKIEIKKIENSTNRQVTYSKRRNGIFKKAQELAVLCDAKVCIIMLSGSGKYHEFLSPNVTMKKMYDQYQKTLGTDLWISHHEKMQEQMRQLKEINNKLKREMRQRIGQDNLDNLSMEQLQGLEKNIDASLALVRGRKYHDIKTKTDTYRKKVKNLEQRHGNLLFDFDKGEDPQYGLVENEGDYESAAAIAFANGVSNLYNFHLQPTHLGPGGALGLHDLRLA
uniref:MADS-box transcription factor n=1 Tax=Cyclamen persicum TaxID=87530 RepID=F1T118_9ERIC|nr:MADS-box transcription factor [Cyclamen persicum]